MIIEVEFCLYKDFIKNKGIKKKKKKKNTSVNTPVHNSINAPINIPVFPLANTSVIQSTPAKTPVNSQHSR